MKYRVARDTARSLFDIENIASNGQSSSQAIMGRRAAAYTLASGKLAKSEQRVLLSEQALGILEVDRWTEKSERWSTTKRFLRERAYRRQLDYLERLVVQRLMELTKVNISGTAYKMRAHISQALKTRSATIRKAVDRYNILADAVKKPRVQYAKVVQYSFLGEFDLLRDTRHDVPSKTWSKPYAVRQWKHISSSDVHAMRSRGSISRLDAWWHIWLTNEKSSRSRTKPSESQVLCLQPSSLEDGAIDRRWTKLILSDCRSWRTCQGAQQ